MNRKTVNISSKRIEQKITAVTSILGIIIMNIIWIAGVRSMNEQPHTSITQNKNELFYFCGLRNFYMTNTAKVITPAITGNT